MKRVLIILMLVLMLVGCSQKLTTSKCNYSKIEVYFYYSPRCPHCENVKPYVDEIRDKYKNVSFHYCNVENASKECYKYAYYVYGVPTIVVHTNGITTSLVGERDIMGLENLIKCFACCDLFVSLGSASADTCYT